MGLVLISIRTCFLTVFHIQLQLQWVGGAGGREGPEGGGQEEPGYTATGRHGWGGKFGA